MKPLSPVGSPLPLRLLNKGPDYLRRQMDAGTRGRSVSAVERLEADKAKYVKSQQVINTKQEPVLNPCATPPPPGRRGFTVSAATSPVTLRRNNNEDDSKKENVRAPGPDVNEQNRNNAVKVFMPSHRGVPLAAPRSAPVMRRSMGKRMLRPDSLLMYRQKKECKSPSEGFETNTGTEIRGYGFVRRLFQSSVREKNRNEVKSTISEEKSSSRDSHMSWSVDGTRRSSRTSSNNGNFLEPALDNHADPWMPVLPLRRSKSDLRLCSSLALSEYERFFDFCGLERDLVDRLGPENFPSGASEADTLSLVLRSVRGLGGGSEPSDFSQHSGEGLVQEELTEQAPTGVSIIERNARVIKWLYGCKNATGEGPEGPKESTV